MMFKLYSLRSCTRECVSAAAVFCLVVSFSQGSSDGPVSSAGSNQRERADSRVNSMASAQVVSLVPVESGFEKSCPSELPGERSCADKEQAAVSEHNSQGKASASSSPRPNVIVMMADAMGLGDTSAYQDFTGNSDADQLHTPSMERLANSGIRFTDAHTPSSRCTLTRYSLMTGRYSWRNRLKHFVLFGVQGDPMIERDRPTLATLFQSQGYSTGIVGKWHIGLRYRQADGRPAAAWEDADLTQPLFDGPIDHGFEFVRVTSRSHGTSGPDAGATTARKRQRNSPQQSIGPGHIHGRQVVSATGRGKELFSEGANAYVLSKLGSRHSDHAMQFLVDREFTKPFFLYYACNSNHSPYTPDVGVGGKPVRRSVSCDLLADGTASP